MIAHRDEKPSIPTRRFKFGVFAACLIIALAHPLSIVLNLKSESWVLLQNEPAFNIFLPLIFPLAVAVIFAGWDITPLWRSSRLSKLLLLSALAVFITLVVISACSSDRTRPLPLARYMLKDSAPALALEVRLRKQLYDPHNSDFRTQENGFGRR